VAALNGPLDFVRATMPLQATRDSRRRHAQQAKGLFLSKPDGRLLRLPRPAPGPIGRQTPQGKRIATADSDFVEYLLEAEGVRGGARGRFRPQPAFPHLLRDLDRGAERRLHAHPAGCAALE